MRGFLQAIENRCEVGKRVLRSRAGVQGSGVRSFALPGRMSAKPTQPNNAPMPRSIPSSDHTTHVALHAVSGPCRIPGILRSKLVAHCTRNCMQLMSYSRRRCEATERMAGELSLFFRVVSPSLDFWYGIWQTPLLSGVLHPRCAGT
jgi:hypothetical protein